MREPKEQSNSAVENGADSKVSSLNEPRIIKDVLYEIVDGIISILEWNTPKSTRCMNEGLGALVKHYNHEVFTGMTTKEDASNVIETFSSLTSWAGGILFYIQQAKERAESGKPLPPDLQVFENRIAAIINANIKESSLD